MRGLLLPAICLVYLCANVGPWSATCSSACPVLRHSESTLLDYLRECVTAGSASAQTACSIVPHSTSLGPATATGVLSTRVPVSAPPTSLDECLYFISLVLDPHAVLFSVSSGRARRRSVSTYAAIMVLSVLEVF